MKNYVRFQATFLLEQSYFIFEENSLPFWLLERETIQQLQAWVPFVKVLDRGHKYQ